ncbi:MULTISPECIES: glycine betaine ABC transporter substrate-binding protein [Burkholderiaceae]|jgi:glycine betaine/proline transport system substrate-binding protein|uniref:Glycine betaine/L-proline ABC transporter, glycine betaine/L-proline-binding/permease protein n=1 Tax=Caballeronia sordidicola TaxID=196367 RepID=A0A242N882_CABSO|nr:MULTISPECIES: glycine betaine ABC transporter substrate-binding protein [Burkholderiaceae]AMM18434.1 glycine/betaine ABC transporter substrate-binding protein [Burkholderia sp. PAMC 28687]MDP9153122.1 glycine betaine ABC transporter substrate-binding protein [Pseudomonadota bacterium]OTP79823.1 Glycine betaine/L-proline ABC transporter, glycine betaine/L-proline- binding/permease protein [Caballeronia sordidicola]
MKLIKKLVVLSAMSAALAAASVSAIAADAKPTIKIGYVEGWDDSVATSNVAAQIIEKKLGYPVQLVPVAAGVMWQGVARGDLDATLSAWLPVTHGAYWENFKTKVVDVGVNFPDAKIGLIVPEDAPVTSLTDLEAKKADFGGRIVGIDAGAGVMSKTSEAIKAYNLDYTLMPSSGSAMTAELARAENAKKPIIVTGWKPHWMFAKYKLKFLEDPKKVFGESEHVDSVINPGLETKAPTVVAFLKKFQWKPGEIDSVMLATTNGAKPAAAADAWVNAHADRVSSWTK